MERKVTWNEGEQETKRSLDITLMRETSFRDTKWSSKKSVSLWKFVFHTLSHPHPYPTLHGHASWKFPTFNITTLRPGSTTFGVTLQSHARQHPLSSWLWSERADLSMEEKKLLQTNLSMRSFTVSVAADRQHSERVQHPAWESRALPWRFLKWYNLMPGNLPLPFFLWTHWSMFAMILRYAICEKTSALSLRHL